MSVHTKHRPGRRLVHGETRIAHARGLKEFVESESETRPNAAVEQKMDGEGTR